MRGATIYQISFVFLTWVSIAQSNGADLSTPDTQSPTITLIGPPSIVLAVGELLDSIEAHANDNSDGDISAQIVRSGEVDIHSVGAYRIAYNVADAAGNEAIEAVRRVYVIDPSQTAQQRAFDYLNDRMDVYHQSFDIYTDFGDGGSHSAPSGWIGSVQSLRVDPAWQSNCFNGNTCFKNTWLSTSPGWVGIRWLQPNGNWAAIAQAGFDLSGARQIEFSARGHLGGEVVEFVTGGITGTHPGSIQPLVKSGPIMLSKDWQKYHINISEQDLTHVIGPFGWTMEQNATFYIDDVRIDLPRPNALRLIQSFEIINLQQELALANTAYIYDNALAMLAFLARGGEDDLRRAKILADTFLYALNNDRYYQDGRLRNAYMSGDIADPLPATARLPGSWDIQSSQWIEDRFNVSTHTGNIAWAMLALLSYYDQSLESVYLDAVITLGNWVEEHTRDARGAGGYMGGYEGWEQGPNNPHPPEKLLYKATEHNIDLYPVFQRLYAITADLKWQQRALHAERFVQSMWDVETNKFWTGTTINGVDINKDNVPVDIQAWAVMAMSNGKDYRAGLDWAEQNCAAELDGFKVFDFNNDLDGGWFEGTAQMVLAYKIVNSYNKSAQYLAELRRAQTQAPNANGSGLVAATHDGVSTGFDWEYFSRLHIGATAWFIFAERGYNPYTGKHVTNAAAGNPAEQIAPAPQESGGGAAAATLPLLFIWYFFQKLLTRYKLFRRHQD